MHLELSGKTALVTGGSRGRGVIVNVIGTGGERPAADYIAGAGAAPVRRHEWRSGGFAKPEGQVHS